MHTCGAAALPRFVLRAVTPDPRSSCSWEREWTLSGWHSTQRAPAAVAAATSAAATWGRTTTARAAATPRPRHAGGLASAGKSSFASAHSTKLAHVPGLGLTTPPHPTPPPAAAFNGVAAGASPCDGKGACHRRLSGPAGLPSQLPCRDQPGTRAHLRPSVMHCPASVIVLPCCLPLALPAPLLRSSVCFSRRAPCNTVPRRLSLTN